MARTWNGSTGSVDTGYTAHAALRSYFLWTYNGGGSLGRIFDKTNSGGTATELFFYDGANLVYTRHRSSVRGEWQITPPSANVWHPLLLTYDSGSTTNDPVVYLDGSAVGTTEVATPSGTLTDSSNKYWIGNRGADDRAWTGRLAQFAIWDVILNANEAMALARGVLPWKIRNADLKVYAPIWGLHSPEIDLVRPGVTCPVVATVLASNPPISQFTPKWAVNPVIEAAAGGGKPAHYYAQQYRQAG